MVDGLGRSTPTRSLTETQITFRSTFRSGYPIRVLKGTTTVLAFCSPERFELIAEAA